MHLHCQFERDATKNCDATLVASQNPQTWVASIEFVQSRTIITDQCRGPCQGELTPIAPFFMLHSWETFVACCLPTMIEFEVIKFTLGT